jgi:hypothetical protein
MFGGEGRSRQEDAETSCCPGWAQPKQTPSPFFSQPCRQVVSQVRSCSEPLIYQGLKRRHEAYIARVHSRLWNEHSYSLISGWLISFGLSFMKSARRHPKAALVFLIDVDNTLLDDSRVLADLRRHLREEVGPAGGCSILADITTLASITGVCGLSWSAATVSSVVSP